MLHYFEGSADGVEDEGGKINKLTKMVGKKRNGDRGRVGKLGTPLVANLGKRC